MRCEKAQEFLSDYIDGSLERPMRVAVEAHVQQCQACAGELTVLRQTWAVLDAMPAVEPPADFAQRLAARVHQERQERRERQWWRLAPLQNWARALTPAHAVGFAAAAALLAVGLAFPLRAPGEHAWWGILNRPDPQPVVTAPNPPAVTAPELPPVEADPTLAPRITLRPLQWDNDRWVGTVVVTPGRDLSYATVSATPLGVVDGRLRGAETVDLAEGTMRAGRPYAMPIPLGGEGPGARAVLLRIAAPSLPQPIRKVLYFPIPSRAPAAAGVSLGLPRVDFHVALAHLAAAARLPVVADAEVTGRISVQLRGASPEHALNEIAASAGARWQRAAGGYIVTRP